MSFRCGKKPNLLDRRLDPRSARWAPGQPSADRQSSIFNLGSVDQHNWDVVLNWVHTPAFAAFQAFAVRIQNHRLPANGANQHVEQILRNHRDNIVMLRAIMCTTLFGSFKNNFVIIRYRQLSPEHQGVRCDRIGFQITASPSEVRWQPGFSTGPK